MRSEEQFISAESEYYTYHPSAIASRVYLYPLSVGHFVYEPGYSLSRSRFDSFLLMYIAKGRCLVTLNGERTAVAAGRYILLDCYEPQSYAFDTTTEVIWLHFNGALARPYYEAITELHGQVYGSFATQTPMEAMYSILELFQGSHTLHEAKVSNTITGLLQVLLESSGEETVSPGRTYAIERARTYISEHYAEPITLELLSRNANISPYHFTRVFAAETGLTPHRYLIAVRLSAAKYLLSSQTIPSIKEIALRCGFHSESSFCTTFRKWEGKTPSEYRLAAFET